MTESEKMKYLDIMIDETVRNRLTTFTKTFMFNIFQDVDDPNDKGKTFSDFTVSLLLNEDASLFNISAFLVFVANYNYQKHDVYIDEKQLIIFRDVILSYSKEKSDENRKNYLNMEKFFLDEYKLILEHEIERNKREFKKKLDELPSVQKELISQKYSEEVTRELNIFNFGFDLNNIAITLTSIIFRKKHLKDINSLSYENKKNKIILGVTIGLALISIILSIIGITI